MRKLMRLKKKNCLLLVVDCLRADKCFNYKIATPAIDFLTDNGTVFTQCIACTSTTSPSFGSILTGHYPLVHGIRSLLGYRLNSEVQTLPEVFRKNKYTTYAFVTGPLMPAIGLNRGFDEYEIRDRYDDIDSKWYENLLARFEKHSFKEPWFILLHLYYLHRSKKDLLFYPDKNSRLHIRFQLKNLIINREKRYNRLLSHLDFKLSKLIEVLDLEKNLIILCSDHGENLKINKLEELYSEAKHHLRQFGKKFSISPLLKIKLDYTINIGHGYNIYDYLVKVPLIFFNKHLFPPGKRIISQVRQIDIFPTIIDSLKLTSHEEVKGRSLMDLIKESDGEKPAYMTASGVVLQGKKNWRLGIRTSKYKYIWAPYNDNIPDELYALENDPEEKVNIAEENPDLVYSFKDNIKRIRTESLKILMRAH